MSKYNSTLPISQSTTGYTQNQYAEFQIEIPKGGMILPNSFRLSGTINLGPAGTNVLMMDHNTGIHSVFRSITVGLYNNSSILSRNTEYPRFFKAMNRATKHNAFTTSRNSNELLLASDDQYDLLKTAEIPFCVKPLISINMCTNPGESGFTDNLQSIHVRIDFAPNSQVFYGPDYLAQTYTISPNFYLHYQVVQAPNNLKPMKLLNYHHLPTDIIGSHSYVSTSIPSNVISVFLSMYNTDNLRTNVPYLQFDELQDLQEVNFGINDSNAVLTYTLKHHEEFIGNYMLALKPDYSQDEMVKDHLDGIGLNFQRILNSNKISIDIKSNNTKIINGHLYCLTVMQL